MADYSVKILSDSDILSKLKHLYSNAKTITEYNFIVDLYKEAERRKLKVKWRKKK